MGKTYKDDFLECYLVLESMHKSIIDGVLFDEDLKARAENCIIDLSEWKLPNKSDQQKRANMVMTILDQLECNKQLCKKKEELFKNYIKSTLTSTVGI